LLHTAILGYFTTLLGQDAADAKQQGYTAACAAVTLLQRLRRDIEPIIIIIIIILFCWKPHSHSNHKQ